MDITSEHISAQPDVQQRAPSLAVGLSRVGVTGVERVIRLRDDLGAERALHAVLECSVDLGPHQKGAHMSRFEEVVNEALDEVVSGESAFGPDRLAERIAEEVRRRQGARSAEVSIAARTEEVRTAPVSGRRTQEMSTLLGLAAASEAGTRRVVGVRATGMTACPCAQELIAAGARERLAADGHDGAAIDRILELVPVATHNQRGLGTLHVGLPEGSDASIDPRTLRAIVEGSMSAETYELMKRSDEAAVVERAHRTPRFVEDVVREMLRGVLDGLAGLDDAVLVSARQENLETIHRHDVVAERAALLGDLRAELAGEGSRSTTLRAWLDDAAA